MKNLAIVSTSVAKIHTEKNKNLQKFPTLFVRKTTNFVKKDWHLKTNKSTIV